MKTMILPCVLLVLCIVFSVVSCVITTSAVDKMITLIDKLPDELEKDTEDEVNQINELWNKNVEFFSAITKYDAISSVSKELESCLAGCQTGDGGTYLAAKKNLKKLILYIKEIHSVRFDIII